MKKLAGLCLSLLLAIAMLGGCGKDSSGSNSATESGRLVDYATVYSDGRVVFTFRNGVEVGTEI